MCVKRTEINLNGRAPPSTPEVLVQSPASTKEEVKGQEGKERGRGACHWLLFLFSLNERVPSSHSDVVTYLPSGRKDSLLPSC